MDCTTNRYVYTSDRESNLATEMRDKAGYSIMPQAILKSVGPYGARLLGAMMNERRPSQPDDFREVEGIADDAFLPVPTARKLLDRLASGGWLQYLGRRPSREGGRCRRSVTWWITKQSWTNRRPWFPWPKWLGDRKRYGSLPPAAHAVYGVILARWCLIERGEDEENGCLDGRQFMGLCHLQDATGLTYNSVRAAIHALRWLVEDRGDYYDIKAVRRSTEEK
jgi:hypothetical protein